MTTALNSGLSPVRRPLSNGAVVTVQETAITPAVTVSAAMRAGSLYDPPELPGLAAFLGRVIDRGTATRSAADVAEALDDRGVTLRMSVNRHTLTVTCTCLSEDFADLLALIADVLRQPSFPQEEIDKRRAETVTALRQDQENPAVRASEALQALLYGPAHPYGRPAKGTLASLDQITRDALSSAHAARFCPSALSLVIVGDVPAGRALEVVDEAFGGWTGPQPAEPVLPPVPAASTRRRVDIQIPDKSQSDIAYGFTTIGRLDPAYYAYWVMNTILGQFGLGGRLAENIRERQGMAYYAFSAFDPSLGPGPLVVRAGVDPRNVERALEAIDREVAALGAEGPTPQELAETKQYLIGSIPRLLETNQGIASFLQTAAFFGLGTSYDRQMGGLLEAVGMDEVRRASAEALRPERAAVAIAGPPPGTA